MVRTYGIDPRVHSLSPLCRKVHDHIKRIGSVSARDAMIDLGITSASLARRICDLEEAGFKIARILRKHKLSGQQYTRYQIVA